MSTSRVRTQGGVRVRSGTYQGYFFGTTRNYEEYFTPEVHLHCEDVVGNPLGDNSFVLRKQKASIGGLNGHYISGSGYYRSESTWNDYPPAIFRLPGFYSTNSWQPDFDPITKLLAITNPSRPVVDIPVFVKELGDLPRLVQIAGKSIYKKVASGNLNWQFGWKPLLSDLGKMLDFGDHWDKKSKEIERLHSKGGLRRNVTLARNENVTVKPSYIVESSVGTWYSHFTESHKTKLWGSVRWIPTDRPQGTGHKDPMLAFRAALGLDVTMSTIWEALPWSWLIDYFGNIGDYLMAHRNTVPAEPTRICIMRYDESVRSYIPTTRPTGGSWSGASIITERKSRNVGGSPKLTIGYLPLLSATQLSILASLAVLRAR